MTNDKLLKLTLAVYRVTDRFPEKEPLKYSIRETAGRIFNFAAAPHNGERSHLESDLELLKNCFLIAKTQNWVSGRNFLALEREYDKVRESFYSSVAEYGDKRRGEVKTGKKEAAKKENSKAAGGSSVVLSPQERKQKIADIIKEREKIALREIFVSFPGISKRTLIRDLENLMREETIKKEGNGRHVIYMPNGRSAIVTS